MYYTFLFSVKNLLKFSLYPIKTAPLSSPIDLPAAQLIQQRSYSSITVNLAAQLNPAVNPPR
jgi:hypothetical protein